MRVFGKNLKNFVFFSLSSLAVALITNTRTVLAENPFEPVFGVLFDVSQFVFMILANAWTRSAAFIIMFVVGLKQILSILVAQVGQSWPEEVKKKANGLIWLVSILGILGLFIGTSYDGGSFSPDTVPSFVDGFLGQFTGLLSWVLAFMFGILTSVKGGGDQRTKTGSGLLVGAGMLIMFGGGKSFESAIALLIGAIGLYMVMPFNSKHRDRENRMLAKAAGGLLAAGGWIAKKVKRDPVKQALRRDKKLEKEVIRQREWLEKQLERIYLDLQKEEENIKHEGRTASLLASEVPQMQTVLQNINPNASKPSEVMPLVKQVVAMADSLFKSERSEEKEDNLDLKIDNSMYRILSRAKRKLNSVSKSVEKNNSQLAKVSQKLEGSELAEVRDIYTHDEQDSNLYKRQALIATDLRNKIRENRTKHKEIKAEDSKKHQLFSGLEKSAESIEILAGKAEHEVESSEDDATKLTHLKEFEKALSKWKNEWLGKTKEVRDLINKSFSEYNLIQNNYRVILQELQQLMEILQAEKSIERSVEEELNIANQDVDERLKRDEKVSGDLGNIEKNMESNYETANTHVEGMLKNILFASGEFDTEYQQFIQNIQEIDRLRAQFQQGKNNLPSDFENNPDLKQELGKANVTVRAIENRSKELYDRANMLRNDIRQQMIQNNIINLITTLRQEKNNAALWNDPQGKAIIQNKITSENLLGKIDQYIQRLSYFGMPENLVKILKEQRDSLFHEFDMGHFVPTA